jgi:hypothetical protein
MLDQLRNVRLSEFAVRENLNFLEREWIIGRLVSKAGVHEALSRSDDPRKLVVEYDADVVNTSELLEFLQLCGLHADVAPLPRADAAEARP